MKVLLITPHLSTGGMPQYIWWSVCELIQDWDVHVVEWTCLSPHYVVQRNRVRAAVGEDHFHCLHNRGGDILPLIERLQPDVIYFAETPEHENEPPTPYIPRPIVDAIYARPGCRFVETTHGGYMPVDKKYSLPDKFILCAEWNRRLYAPFGRDIDLHPYPIWPGGRVTRAMALTALGLDPRRRHVLNTALFTWNKNQAAIWEIAPLLPEVQFHFLGNQADNFRGYWQPLMARKPANCHVWGERDDVDRWCEACDALLFPSKLELAPIAVREALSWGMPVLLHNLETNCGQWTEGPKLRFLTGDAQRDADLLLSVLPGPPAPTPFSQSLTSTRRCVGHKTPYGLSLPAPKPLGKPPKITLSFAEGPRVDIGKDGSDSTFLVEFIDGATGRRVFEQQIKGGHWAAANRRYYTPWRVRVATPQQTIVECDLSLKGAHVYVPVESGALGDTLAWMPYIEEFRRRHGCRLTCSTSHNELFAYPAITFVRPGTVVQNLQAIYRVGCFSQGDRDRSPAPWNTLPVQRIASSILGLPHRELLPSLRRSEAAAPCLKPYVCLGTGSTAQCKHWNRPGGWREVVTWLRAQGYQVFDLASNADRSTGADRVPEGPVAALFPWLQHAQAFVGLSSGLSWLAWALQTPVVTLAGATAAWNEPATNWHHIEPPEDTCSGCLNTPGLNFDRSRGWCPRKAHTPQQYECTSTITPQMVISALAPLLQPPSSPPCNPPATPQQSPLAAAALPAGI